MQEVGGTGKGMFSSKEIEKESFLPSRGEQCRNVTEFGRGDQTRVLGSSPTGHFSSDESRVGGGSSLEGHPSPWGLDLQCWMRNRER